jgi:hypothetical protein
VLPLATLSRRRLCGLKIMDNSVNFFTHCEVFSIAQRISGEFVD